MTFLKEHAGRDKPNRSAGIVQLGEHQSTRSKRSRTVALRVTSSLVFARCPTGRRASREPAAMQAPARSRPSPRRPGCRCSSEAATAAGARAKRPPRGHDPSRRHRARRDRLHVAAAFVVQGLSAYERADACPASSARRRSGHAAQRARAIVGATDQHDSEASMSSAPCDWSPW